MPRNRTIEHKTGERLERSPWLSDATRRRMLNALHKHDADSVRLNQVIVRELRTVRREYRRTLAALMGLAGARRYSTASASTASAPTGCASSTPQRPASCFGCAMCTSRRAASSSTTAAART